MVEVLRGGVEWVVNRELMENGLSGFREEWVVMK